MGAPSSGVAPGTATKADAKALAARLDKIIAQKLRQAKVAPGPKADPAQLARTLETALGDAELRRHLAEAGRARASTFTWDRCAAGVVSVIRELVA